MKKMNFEELKNFVSKAKNVHHWNGLRNIARFLVSENLITQLDCSGYIHHVSIKNNW